MTFVRGHFCIFVCNFLCRSLIARGGGKALAEGFAKNESFFEVTSITNSIYFVEINLYLRSKRIICKPVQSVQEMVTKYLG